MAASPAAGNSPHGSSVAGSATGAGTRATYFTGVGVANCYRKHRSELVRLEEEARSLLQRMSDPTNDPRPREPAHQPREPVAGHRQQRVTAKASAHRPREPAHQPREPVAGRRQKRARETASKKTATESRRRKRRATFGVDLDSEEELTVDEEEEEEEEDEE